MNCLCHVSGIWPVTLCFGLLPDWLLLWLLIVCSWSEPGRPVRPAGGGSHAQPAAGWGSGVCIHQQGQCEWDLWVSGNTTPQAGELFLQFTVCPVSCLELPMCMFQCCYCCLLSRVWCLSAHICYYGSKLKQCSRRLFNCLKDSSFCLYTLYLWVMLNISFAVESLVWFCHKTLFHTLFWILLHTVAFPAAFVPGGDGGRRRFERRQRFQCTLWRVHCRNRRHRRWWISRSVPTVYTPLIYLPAGSVTWSLSADELCSDVTVNVPFFHYSEHIYNCVNADC